MNEKTEQIEHLKNLSREWAKYFSASHKPDKDVSVVLVPYPTNDVVSPRQHLHWSG